MGAWMPILIVESLTPVAFPPDGGASLTPRPLLLAGLLATGGRRRSGPRRGGAVAGDRVGVDGADDLTGRRIDHGSVLLDDAAGLRIDSDSRCQPAGELL